MVRYRYKVGDVLEMRSAVAGRTCLFAVEKMPKNSEGLLFGRLYYADGTELTKCSVPLDIRRKVILAVHRERAITELPEEREEAA